MKILRTEEFRGTHRFRILRRLGAGGMGVVYEALDRDTGALVALKTLMAPTPESLLRFKREFRSLQDIQHPNLVTLGELVEADGVWFFTMELVRGQSLLAYVRRGAGGAVAASSSAFTLDVPGGMLDASLITPRSVRLATPMPGSFDEGRLRSTLVQIGAALGALHDAGLVHRDVKPSNILVTEEGRAVLLDLGLVLDLDRQTSLSAAHVVGTAVYMAPEQAAGRGVGPEADWYSVGVMLHEALLGRPPFVGAHMEVMLEKQRCEPAAPSAVIAGVPPDLDRLCVDLLRFDPAARPGGREVLDRLGGAAAARGSSPGLRLPGASQSSIPLPPFVGRDAELAVLRDAFGHCLEKHPVAVYVHGESGIGKTALVRRFVDDVAADPSVVVLAGRCYEREAVPFRAFDGVVDALALHLQRLPTDQVAAVLPRRAALLLQVFPVLRRVDVFADAPRFDVADPQELRTRVFEALRELLTRLAERRPMVVVIDDLQWADADSFALLRELLRPPEAPPLLLLATWREAGEDDTIRQALASLPGEHRHLSLEALAPEAAQQLARQVLAASGAGGGDPAQIAREAGGHPLFIDELARFVAHRGAEARSHLDEVLWTRISELEPPARHLVELLAVAGAPLDQNNAARAAGMSPVDLARCAAQLRVLNLARTTGARRSDRIEPYHDRVRAAVLAHLGPDVRRARHRDLARAFEGSDQIDREALAVHFRGAGDLEKAARYAADAASAAASALAFDRAVTLYRMALELLPEGRPEIRALRVQLGDALAHAGHGSEAARVYLEAAMSATSGEALDLRRRAAQQFLLSGNLDEGVGVLGAVMTDEGIGYPRTPLRALAGVVGRRLYLSVRGHGFRRRDEGEITSRDLARIDACWHAGIALSTADTIRGTAYMSQCLVLALRAGEPYRISRALSIEAAMVSLGGIPAEAKMERLLVLAQQLADQVGSAHARALVLGTRGQAHYVCGRFRPALEICQQAEAELREHCTGVSWELNTMRLWSARALFLMGRFHDLRRRLPAYLDENTARGDIYGDVNLRTSLTPYLHLADDDPDAALAEVRAAESRWSPTGFHIQHNYSLHTQLGCALYRGDHASAAEVARALRSGIKHSLLHRVQMIRVTTGDITARVALAGAVDQPESAARVAADVRRTARRVAAEGTPIATPIASALEAGAAAITGALDAAARHLEAAIDGFDRADMSIHGAAARRRLGQLLGGDQGRSLVTAADAWMAGEGVRNPDAFTAMLVPGFRR